MSEQTAAANAGDGLACEKRGALGLITLARPEKRNALTIAGRARIAEALPKYARDPIIYAVVVRSATEGMFCTGGDIVEMAALADRDMEAAEKALGDEIAQPVGLLRGERAAFDGRVEIGRAAGRERA